MIKTYCDICGILIERSAHRKVFTYNFPASQTCDKVRTVQVTTLVSINKEMGEGDICAACVQKVVLEGSISPKPNPDVNP